MVVFFFIAIESWFNSCYQKYYKEESTKITEFTRERDKDTEGECEGD